MDMAVDVMFDRGFALRGEVRRRSSAYAPVSGLAPSAGEGSTRRKAAGPYADDDTSFHFKITFEPPKLHNVAAERVGVDSGSAPPAAKFDGLKA